MHASVSLGDGVERALGSMLDFLPRLTAFILVLLIGYVVAKTLASSTGTILERVGFDRAFERGGLSKALANSRCDVSDIVAAIVYSAILLFALQLALRIFPDNPVSELVTGIIAFLPQIVVAIVILVVGSAIATGVKDLVQGTLGGLGYGDLLGTIASVVILLLTIVAALNQVEIAATVTTPILIAILATVGGVLVVGVGGGLIGPMRKRWGGWLSTVENETNRFKAGTRATPVDLTETSDLTDTSTGVYDQDADDQTTSGDTHRWGASRSV